MKTDATITVAKPPHRTVPLPGDPVAHAAGLLRHGLDKTQVLYENQSEVRVAIGVAAEVTATGRAVISRGPAGERRVEPDGDPLGALAALLAELPLAGWTGYGWAAFELAYALAGTATTGTEPLLRVIVPRIEVRFRSGEALITAADPGELALVAALLAAPHKPAEPECARVPVPVHTRDERYLAAVADCLRAITAGDLQKVVLSREVPVPGPVDFTGSYLVGRRHNTPARSFVIDTPELRVFGFSPETVAEIDADGTVRTQPLAGTRARTGDAGDDERLRHDLTTDAKEIFEHAVSVKLAHEELSRICRPGSTAVSEFMAVKERGSVQHLGSTVTGLLPEAEGAGAAQARTWRAFGALFPAVTASGVPKQAAYRMIRDHEPSPRGLYAGAVFSIDHAGALDAALVLRTAFGVGDRVWLRAGAGVVSGSRPEREFTETCEKLDSVARYLVRPAED
ncbi:salicylate synthase [Streptomyces sp. CA-111067]|uniref:salicylate synthase n=1 Tax=Streptomyces sp. CA-111067 TaxID=3240046 RepID=UPI003D993F83